MDDPKQPAAADPAATRPASAPAPAQGKANAAAGELDLALDEIQRPELMKEGFVGQER